MAKTPCKYIAAWMLDGTYQSHVKEHRVIAERALGKSLPKSAVIHHVNENRVDNRGCNLVVCQDNAYHQFLHKLIRIKKAGGNPWTQRICITCRKLVPVGDILKAKKGRGDYCKACNAVGCRDRAERRAVARRQKAA